MSDYTARHFRPNTVSERDSILHYKVRQHYIEKAWIEFENAGFEPILIKGWAAARLYPEPFRRAFTDMDLLIAPNRFEEAVEFSKGVEQNIAVDLHEGARHLDRVPFENLFVNSRIIECGAAPIRILRPEDHLRVLCVHWLNDGGAPAAKLWDIYHAIANRPKDFDWQRCLEIVSPKRRRWIVCAVGLAHKYLGLELADTPVAAEAEDLPGWLIKAVEREWRSDIRLTDFRFVANTRSELFKQLKKRIPPNPIQATVEMEGDFDRSPRFIYQIGNVLIRLMTAVKKILR